ncbi:MAG: lytic transglycosylase domain-containing protein [Gammaproteobacteria bacterium]|nr:MAG: lytic transglycosylase domain-containing protein [Gammaproteobacteria bacterium]
MSFTRSFLPLALTILTTSASVNAETFTLKGSLFEKVGLKQKIDPLLLYSIALAESGMGVGNGLIRPKDLVIRFDGEALSFSTKEEAQTRLKSILATSNNVDVGVMQVNLKHNPQPNPLSLFDPENNIETGAQILVAAMKSSPDNLVIGIGRYHNWSDIERCRWYGNMVLTIHSNLQRYMAVNRG